MRTTQTRLARGLVVLAAVTVATGVVSSRAQQPPPAAAAGYAWAESCKSCHQDVYASWEKTKHANALERLSGAEQQQECINCHTTGGAGKLEVDGKFVNRGVQCEACHGPSAEHVADPTKRGRMTKTPPPSACEACHNSKSPRFRGFFYAGMVKLSHAMPAKKTTH